MDWRDGSKKWIVGMVRGWTDKRMEGCCIVVLISFLTKIRGCCSDVLILFSRKAKFSYFRQKFIFAKSEIFAFSWAIFAKNENDF
jgi:hypothetical protein